MKWIFGTGLLTFVLGIGGIAFNALFYGNARPSYYGFAFAVYGSSIMLFSVVAYLTKRAWKAISIRLTKKVMDQIRMLVVPAVLIVVMIVAFIQCGEQVIPILVGLILLFGALWLIDTIIIIGNERSLKTKEKDEKKT